jgi:hypothetical protein
MITLISTFISKSMLVYPEKVSMPGEKVCLPGGRQQSAQNGKKCRGEGMWMPKYRAVNGFGSLDVDGREVVKSTSTPRTFL